jgi:3',5'-cyclic AMP phosphodiesterase CpdA
LSLVHQRKPDYVVISGDLTQRARPEQFAAAKRFVDSIPCPTLAVPGNHDVPLYRFWERLVVPFGAWQKHFSPHLEPHLVDDHVCMVGLNTAFNRTITGGRITRAQCNRVREVFSAAPASSCRIAVIHHNLVRPDDLDDVPTPLQGSVPALAALASSGVEMVLSGHLHQSYVAPLLATKGEEGGVILCAGTTTSSRGRGRESGVSTCHWIEIDATETRVLFYRWDSSSLSFSETGTRRFPRRAAIDRAEPMTGGGQRA